MSKNQVGLECAIQHATWFNLIFWICGFMFQTVLSSFVFSRMEACWPCSPSSRASMFALNLQLLRSIWLHDQTRVSPCVNVWHSHIYSTAIWGFYNCKVFNAQRFDQKLWHVESLFGFQGPCQIQIIPNQNCCSKPPRFKTSLSECILIYYLI